MVYLQDSVVLLGDSITQGSYELDGIASRLAHVYNRKMDVINRGFSGYNAPWALLAFKQFFQTENYPKVQLLTIWFGANDAVLPHKAQHVPLDKFVASLKEIIAIARERAPGIRIVLIAAPPFNPPQWQVHLDSKVPPVAMDRDFENTRKYAQATVNLGAEEGLPVVDCFTSIFEAAGNVQDNLSKFMTDGLHLNGAGYEIVWNDLIAAIKTKFPEIDPDNMKMLFPYWDQVDPEDPEKSLTLQ